MMKKDKVDKNYVSELDVFLKRFDTQHPEKSHSQRREIEKAKRISTLRDDPHAKRDEDDFLLG